MSTPTECKAVTWEMRGEDYAESVVGAQVGDLLWNPKMGEGHVLVAERRCGSLVPGGRLVDCGCGGWGMQPCTSMTLVCQCGEDGSRRDHHYCLLARPESEPSLRRVVMNDPLAERVDRGEAVEQYWVENRDR